MENLEYVGQELELFRDARNWKAMWSRHIQPHTSGHLLEVGAGIGTNLPYLANPATTRITAVEPDRALAQRIPTHLGSTPVFTIHGTLDALPADQTFDCIAYIDVLEHIRDDHREATAAWQRLNPGGHLAILSPAFKTLWSPFDEAVGHERRYTRRSLRAILPHDATILKLRYLDSAGATASFVNRLLLRNTLPTKAQIHFWDRTLVPLSNASDLILSRLVGRSVLALIRKPAPSPPAPSP